VGLFVRRADSIFHLATVAGALEFGTAHRQTAVAGETRTIGMVHRTFQSTLCTHLDFGREMRGASNCAPMETIS
jgi:hypothetical protein